MQKNSKLPAHIAFIMDGNGRWAKERFLPRAAGRREGAKRIKEIIKVSRDLGVKFVTFFAFSNENWGRAKNEINVLFHILNNFLEREIRELDKNNVRFMVIGRGQPIPESLQRKIARAEEKTRDNSAITVVLALNYGGRQEIVDAAKKLAKDALAGKISLEELDENIFSKYLYTADIPDPDLLIRTSGEMRISNFLLWQLSYAEFYFTKVYWPDFNKDELLKAVEEYQNRSRRFGKVGVA